MKPGKFKTADGCAKGVTFPHDSTPAVQANAAAPRRRDRGTALGRRETRRAAPDRQLFTEIDPPLKAISEKDQGTYATEGVLVLRQAFAESRVQALLEGVERMIDKGLAGECELGWIDRELRLPARTGHLLNPDKYHPAFADWIDADLAPHLEALVSGGEVRHCLFGMLAGGGGQPYTQKWHRDLCRPGGADETAYLRRHEGSFVQFNAPLVAGDRFLHIVPGSHRRASTAAEIEASRSESGAMPNALVVGLEPGDIAYYNANLWHRGWNPEGRKRWTLHCAFWSAGATVMAHEHGQREPLTRDGHLDRMPP